MFDFNTIKKGDRVVIDAGHLGCAGVRCPYEITSVERTTATLIITNKGRFYKKNGHSVRGRPDKWSPMPHLVEPTPEVVEFIHRHRMCSKLKHTEFDKLSTQTLLQICKLIEEDTSENVPSDS